MICTRIISRRIIKEATGISKREFRLNKVEYNSHQVSEVQIEVPWGFIAGKLWSNGDKQPLLALHGWQDNAGSFDMLAPLLKNKSILAVDSPGHGLSSWLPKGIPYHDLLMVHMIRRIKRYFGWGKIKFLGHSAGAIGCFRYASLYPDDVEFVVAIDALQFDPLVTSKIAKRNHEMARSIDKYLKYEEKNSPAPSHTEQVAIERWIKASHGSLNEMATKTLMIRGATKKEDGTYFFNRDQNVRLNVSNIGYTAELLQELAKVIKCPYIVLRGTESKLQSIFSQDVMDILQNSCKEFSVHMVPGTHHVHMINPQGIAEIVNPFLERHDN